MKYNGKILSVKESEPLIKKFIEGPNFLDIAKQNTDDKTLNIVYLINEIFNDTGMTLETVDIYSIFKEQNPGESFSVLHEYGHKPEEKEIDDLSDIILDSTINLLNKRDEELIKNDNIKENDEVIIEDLNEGKKDSNEVEVDNITKNDDISQKNESKDEKELEDDSEISEEDKIEKRKRELAAIVNKKSKKIKKMNVSNFADTIFNKIIMPIDRNKDYYSDLGVEINDNANQITNTYLIDKDMRMSFHNPDRKDKENIESFKKSKKAYKVLKRKTRRDWYILNKVDKEEIDEETLKSAYKGRLFIRKLPKRIFIGAMVLGVASLAYANKEKISNQISKLFDSKDKEITFEDNIVNESLNNGLKSQINTGVLVNDVIYDMDSNTAYVTSSGANPVDNDLQSINNEDNLSDSANYEYSELPNEYYFLDAFDNEQVNERASAINYYLQASNVNSFSDEDVADVIRFINGSYTPTNADDLYDIKEKTETLFSSYAIAQAQASNFAGGLVEDNGVHVALGLNAFLVDNSEHKEFMDEASTLFINVLTAGDNIENNLEEKKNACKEFFIQMADLMENKVIDANGDEFGYESLTPGEGYIYGVMTHMAFPVIDSAIPNYAVATLDNLNQNVLIDLMILQHYYNPECQEDIDLTLIENENLRKKLENSANENSFNKHFLALLDRAEFKLYYGNENKKSLNYIIK